MSNKQGDATPSPREADAGTDTPTDASRAVSGHGDTSRAPRRKVRAVRFRDHNGEIHGKVRLIHGEVFMNQEAAEFLRTFNAGLRGRLVTQAEGERYLRALLASYRASYSWTEEGE